MVTRFCVVLVAMLCFSTTAQPQDHPFRVAVGYDAATTEGVFPGTFFEGSYQSSNGAFRFDVSFDVLRGRPAGFVYATFAESLFAYAYNGYGIGARFYEGRKRNGLYGGAGLGWYIPSKQTVIGSDSHVGAKLFLGYDTHGALFIETGLTLISASEYSPAPAIALGLRF